MPFKLPLHLLIDATPFEVIVDFLVVFEQRIEGEPRPIRYFILIPIIYRISACQVDKIKETPKWDGRPR